MTRASEIVVAHVVVTHQQKEIDRKRRLDRDDLESFGEQTLDRRHVEIVDVMRRRDPPRVESGRAQRRLKRAVVVGHHHGDQAARVEQAVDYAHHFARIRHVLQHLVQMHDVETSQRGRRLAVQKRLRDVEPETAAVVGGLRRRLQAANDPAAALDAVQEEHAGTGSDVEQRVRSRAQHALEQIVPLRVDQVQPLAILEVPLDVERFLGRVVLVTVNVFEFRRCRDGDDVPETARLAVDDREAVDCVQRHTGVALPRALFGHLWLS